MIRFWIRTDRDSTPDMVLRQYTDDEGIWHTESRTPHRAEWETYLRVDYSGAGELIRTAGQFIGRLSHHFDYPPRAVPLSV